MLITGIASLCVLILVAVVIVSMLIDDKNRLHKDIEKQRKQIDSLEKGLRDMMNDRMGILHDKLRVERTLASQTQEISTLRLQHAQELTRATREAREDALARSRAVMRGQATEHLAPYLQGKFNPKDFRFIGDPIDYLIVVGGSDLHDGETDEVELLLLDIKTGKSQLSKIQRRIRDAITRGDVTFGAYYPESSKWILWSKDGKTVEIDESGTDERDNDAPDGTSGSDDQGPPDDNGDQ